MNKLSFNLMTISFAVLLLSLLLLALVAVVVKFLIENSVILIGLIALVAIKIVLYQYLKILLTRWERDRAWKKLEQEINAELDEEFAQEKK